MHNDVVFQVDCQYGESVYYSYIITIITVHYHLIVLFHDQHFHMARQARPLPACVIHPIISKMAADMTTKKEANISIKTMKRRRLHRTKIFKMFAEVSR